MGRGVGAQTRTFYRTVDKDFLKSHGDQKGMEPAAPGCC